MSSDIQSHILYKIEDALNKKERSLRKEWGSPVGGDMFTADDPTDEDVPNVQDQRDYKTHWNLSSESDIIAELLEKEEVPPEEIPPGQEMQPQEMPPGQEMPPEQMPPGEDAMGGMDGGMGMYGEEIKDRTDLGRTYELKKIYSRLISLESYLASSSSEELLIVRKYISQTLELFETLSANVKSFKDNLDEILVMFYNFINLIYVILEKFYKKVKMQSKNKK